MIQTISVPTDNFLVFYGAFNNNVQYYPTALAFAAPNTLTLTLNGAPNIQATLPYFEDKLLTGFVPSVSGAGPYTLDTTAGTYQLNGQLYSLLNNSVAIPPADPLLDRIDLLVVNGTPGFQYVTGTASATPVEPAVPAGTLPIVFIFVSNSGTGTAPGPTPAAPVDSPNFLRLGASAVGVNVKGNFGSGANILFNFDGAASAINNVAIGSQNKRFHGSAYASMVLIDNAAQIITTKGVKGIQNVQIATQGQIDYGAGTTTATTPARNFMVYCNNLDLIDNQTNRNAYFWAGGTMRGNQNLQIGGTVTVNATFSLSNCQLLGVSKTFSASDTNTTFVNTLALEQNGAPAVTANKLYRIGGALYFNGGAVGGTAPIQPGTVLNSMARWDGVNWVEVGTEATVDSVGVLQLTRNVIGTSVKDISFDNNQFDLLQTRPTGVATPFRVRLQGRTTGGADGTGLTFAQLLVGNGNPGTFYSRAYAQWDEPTGLFQSYWETLRTGQTQSGIKPLEDSATAGNRRVLLYFTDIANGWTAKHWATGREIISSFDDTDHFRGEIMILRSNIINTQDATYLPEPVFIGSTGAQTAVGVKNVVFSAFSNLGAPIQHSLNNTLVTTNFKAYGSFHTNARSVNANTTFTVNDAAIVCTAGNTFQLPAFVAGVLLPGRTFFIRNQTGSSMNVQGNGMNINGAGAALNIANGNGVTIVFINNTLGWYVVS